MTYILAEQRHAGGPPEFNAAFARYRGYLAANAQVFPSGAYELATSDWYFDFANHRSPHDAWLEEAAFTEADSDRGRVVRLTIRLLGAYHDGHIVLEYPEVFGYAFEGDRLAPGHGDWRYDEFRLAENGHLIHEIEWARAGATPGGSSRPRTCAMLGFRQGGPRSEPSNHCLQPTKRPGPSIERRIG